MARDGFEETATLNLPVGRRGRVGQARDLAQQHSAKGASQVNWRLGPTPACQGAPRHEGQMSHYRLEVQAPVLFP